MLKVALGFQVAEVTEEYAEVDGALKLTKRKKIKKDVPPDLKAVQLLLAGQDGGNILSMTDEELEEEKQRLLLLLKEEMKEEKASKKTKGRGQVCVEGQKKRKSPLKKEKKEE